MSSFQFGKLPNCFPPNLPQDSEYPNPLNLHSKFAHTYVYLNVRVYALEQARG